MCFLHDDGTAWRLAENRAATGSDERCPAVAASGVFRCSQLVGGWRRAPDGVSDDRRGNLVAWGGYNFTWDTMGPSPLLEVVMLVANRKPFHPPTFADGDVEFRFEEGEVCIYATTAGLGKLRDLMLLLARRDVTTHLHLEDYQVLTSASLPAVIAVLAERSAGDGAGAKE